MFWSYKTFKTAHSLWIFCFDTDEKRKLRLDNEKVVTSANVFNAAAGDEPNHSTSLCKSYLNLVYGRDIFNKVETIPEDYWITDILSEKKKKIVSCWTYVMVKCYREKYVMCWKVSSKIIRLRRLSAESDKEIRMVQLQFMVSYY